MSDQTKENCVVNLKLVRLIKAHPCLYDRSDANHLRRDNFYTQCAWAKISREMNETVAACKIRWKNIRTRFGESANLYKRALGPNRVKPYYLHDELQFLIRHIVPGRNLKTLTPIAPDRNHTEPQQSINQSDDICTFETSLDLESSSPQPPTVQEQIQEEEIPISKPDPEPDNEEQPPQAKKYRGNISNESPTVNMQQKRDPDFDFLTSLLPDLKTMNSRQKIIFRRKVFQALEKVFSDPMDFPQKHDSLVSEKSLQIEAPASRGPLARREYSQYGEFSIVELIESHTKIKPKIEVVEEDY